LPVIINYALPGQEQGNLQLLQKDGVGISVASTAELQCAVSGILDNNAAVWLRMKQLMMALNRSNGASRIIDDFERRFFV